MMLPRRRRSIDGWQRQSGPSAGKSRPRAPPTTLKVGLMPIFSTTCVAVAHPAVADSLHPQALQQRGADDRQLSNGAAKRRL